MKSKNSSELAYQANKPGVKEIVVWIFMQHYKESRHTVLYQMVSRLIFCFFLFYISFYIDSARSFTAAATVVAVVAVAAVVVTAASS